MRLHNEQSWNVIKYVSLKPPTLATATSVVISIHYNVAIFWSVDGDAELASGLIDVQPKNQQYSAHDWFRGFLN